MFVLIPLFPLLGVLLNGLLGMKFFSKRAVHTVAVSAVGLSFAASVVSLLGLGAGQLGAPAGREGRPLRHRPVLPL
jgi:NADH:ubiquinone oxidoreductase subunit 5 (subunit L)/multisubunit Na+/H+ antiporter MnhA subunit